MRTKVVNKFAEHEAGWIDITRNGPWGNPFTVEDHGREGAIALFEAWARHSAHPRALWIRTHILELYGEVLGCVCKPRDCHGDVLVEMAREAHLKLNRKRRRAR